MIGDVFGRASGYYFRSNFCHQVYFYFCLDVMESWQLADWIYLCLKIDVTLLDSFKQWEQLQDFVKRSGHAGKHNHSADHTSRKLYAKQILIFCKFDWTFSWWVIYSKGKHNWSNYMLLGICLCKNPDGWISDNIYFLSTVWRQ